MRKLRALLLETTALVAVGYQASAQQSPNVVTETATTPRSGVQCQSVTATIATQNTLTFNVPFWLNKSRGLTTRLPGCGRGGQICCCAEATAMARVQIESNEIDFSIARIRTP